MKRVGLKAGLPENTIKECADTLSYGKELFFESNAREIESSIF